MAPVLPVEVYMADVHIIGRFGCGLSSGIIVTDNNLHIWGCTDQTCESFRLQSKSFILFKRVINWNIHV